MDTGHAGPPGLAYRFKNPALLRAALTHRSYGGDHNERLEFLGDGVLDCAVAELLFLAFPALDEGRLSRLRARLVNQGTLAAAALRLNLGAHLLLGEGELRSGGAQRPSMLADALEALIGAIFLDSGYAAAREAVDTLLAEEIAALDSNAGTDSDKDPKTLLQEWLQARRLALPLYRIVDTRGEAHEQVFRVECAIPPLNLRAEGEGSSRRGAEQAAAHAAHLLLPHG